MKKLTITEFARMGGKARAEKLSAERRRQIASEAGKKGGESVPDEKRPFSQDRELAREAGKKGGESSGGGNR